MHQYPETPRVGVGAVVFWAEGQSVLLVRRGKPPSQNRWALPGGSVELGETAAAAAAREVQEECGLKVEVGPVVDVIDVIERDLAGRVQFHYVLCEFLAFPKGDLGAISAADDAADVRWVRWDDVAQLPDIADQVAAVVARARQLAEMG